MKTTYTVQHEPTGGEITVEIDEEFVTGSKTCAGLMKSMVDFWTGSEKRLDENDGDYTRTFLKQLCERAMILSANSNLNAYGVIKELKEEEGWLALDGTFGINLITVSRPELDYQSDYKIEESKTQFT